jgi:hypothetical protein
MEGPRGRPGRPTAKGYWLVNGHGSVFTFGDARSFGSGAAGDVVAMAPSPGGNGYWLFGANGQVRPLGAAPALGPATAVPGKVVAGIGA